MCVFIFQLFGLSTEVREIHRPDPVGYNKMIVWTAKTQNVFSVTSDGGGGGFTIIRAVFL